MNLRASLPLLASAALVLSAAGCAKPSATVVLSRVCSPPAPSASGGCLWPTSTCTTTPLGEFAVDVDQASGLYLGVMVSNMLADNANPDTGANNTHDAFLENYSVSYAAPSSLDGSGGSLEESLIEPQGSTIVETNLFDTKALSALYAALHGTPDVMRVDATVTLKGKWGDQKKFETAPRTYSVNICAGCLAPPTCGSGETLFVCGGDGQYPATYSCSGSGFSVAGTIIGTLTGDGLVLHCTGLQDLAVPSGATTFTFAGSLANGTPYSCSVGTQPTAQTCTITTGATGTVAGTDVALAVTCN